MLSDPVPAMDKASIDFVEMLNENDEVCDILEELKKYFLEVTGIVVLGQSLKSIQNNLKADSEAACLMKAAMETNSHILGKCMRVLFARGRL